MSENKEQMSQEMLIKKADDEKNVKILASIEKLKNKQNKFMFCVPDTTQPNASVYEIYFHAKTLQNLGYNVIMLTENKDYVVPEFIEKSLVDEIEHTSMQDTKITVSPDDFMIIPDLFSNVMEQTKKLPCKRIGFLQSFDYMLNSLIPGTTWNSFGVSDIITTSKTLSDMVVRYYDKMYNIKTYDIGIPDYFNADKNMPKKPIVSIVGRNANDISKVVKLFYARYPHFNWISFDPMLTKKKPPQPMRRVDFANRLKNNFAAIWIDRIASFGTFPLECMKSGTIPVALKPDITPPYIHNEEEMLENVGYWTNDIYDIPEILGNLLTKFLDDNIDDTVFEGMRENVEKYNPQNSAEQLKNVYEEFVNERIEFFEKSITNNNNKKTNENE